LHQHCSKESKSWVNDLCNSTMKPFLTSFCLPGEGVETIMSGFRDGSATIASQLHSHCCPFLTGMSILEVWKTRSIDRDLELTDSEVPNLENCRLRSDPTQSILSAR
jgi:hypothetical protein